MFHLILDSSVFRYPIVSQLRITAPHHSVGVQRLCSLEYFYASVEVSYPAICGALIGRE